MKFEVSLRKILLQTTLNNNESGFSVNLMIRIEHSVTSKVTKIIK